MTNSTTSKFVAAVVGFALALTVFVGVGASTAGAQAMTLSQLVDLFISLGIISSDKAAAAKAAVSSSATASSYTFSSDLTVGSSGEAVTALQNAVGVSPATGYFGAVTKAAVQKYQAANGISATGYVGPLTRAALNKSGTVTTGTTTGGSSAVVNSGVEGTLTVNKASIPSNTVYEGESMKTLLGIKLEAKLSEINVQRVKLNLGASTSFYTKVFKTMYVTDDSGKVVAQADLNSNTVVKDGTSYFLTLGGFNYTVAKDATKYLWVKADVYSSIDSNDRTSRTVTLPIDGVRGTDGAGIDQYAPGSSFAQTLSVSSSLTDSATLDLSLNSANFKATEVVADQGAAYDELDGLNVLSFDLRANRDNVDVTDLAIAVSSAGAGATVNQVYLYDGSNRIAAESPVGNVAVFTDIDNLSIAKDAVKTLTVKIDVRGAATSSTTFTASASSTSFAAENSIGDDASVSGTASGEAQIVRKIGPVFTLNSISNGTVSKTTNQSGHATSTLPVTFSIDITAKGADLTFGVAGNTWALATTTQVAFYQNSVETAIGTIMTSGSNVTVVYDDPSSKVTLAGNVFTLAKGGNVTIPLRVSFTVGRTSGSDSYAVGLKGLNWGIAGAATTTSTFMAGKTEWRSSAVTLP